MSDVLNYGIEVYGRDADQLLRKLAQLLSRRELENFWASEIGWNCDREAARKKFFDKLTWAEARARNSGWETNDA